MTDATFGAALARLWPHAPRSMVAAIEAIAEEVFSRFGVEPTVIGALDGRLDLHQALLEERVAARLFEILPGGDDELRRFAGDLLWRGWRGGDVAEADEGFAEFAIREREGFQFGLDRVDTLEDSAVLELDLEELAAELVPALRLRLFGRNWHGAPVARLRDTRTARGRKCSIIHLTNGFSGRAAGLANPKSVMQERAEAGREVAGLARGHEGSPFCLLASPPLSRSRQNRRP